MDKAKFYAHVRAKLGSLTSKQVLGFEEVLKAIAGAPLSHQAYMLATTWHETAGTMEPVKEAYWMSEAWRKANLRYYPEYGRGYVQLTWDYNYAKADNELYRAGLIKKHELIQDLDVALRPAVAAFILRRGMDQGWFTGKRLLTYLPSAGVATRDQYIAARKIINGLDKADLVEDYAQVFEKALRNGGLG